MVKICEKFDPFKRVKKVKMSDDEWFVKRRTGKYVTDGYGNIYEIPLYGFSDDLKVNGHRYRYDFKTKEIQRLDNSGKVEITMPLNVTEWFDNPEYWALKFDSEAIY